jgi:hypothetical protein
VEAYLNLYTRRIICKACAAETPTFKEEGLVKVDTNDTRHCDIVASKHCHQLWWPMLS